MTNGQIAYEGYFKACGGKSLISGQPLPEWDKQSEPIKAAWEEAAEEVIQHFIKDTGLQSV